MQVRIALKTAVIGGLLRTTSDVFSQPQAVKTLSSSSTVWLPQVHLTPTLLCLHLRGILSALFILGIQPYI